MKQFILLFAVLLFAFTTAFSQSFTKGSQVEIKWLNAWYKGTIVEVKGDQYKVSYEGYSASWDEWVKADRLRRPAGSQQAPTTTGKPNNGTTTPKPTPAPTPATTSPVRTPVAKPVAGSNSYKDTGGKLYFRTFMWTSMYGSELEISWIYLGNGGSIVRNPKNGLNPVNFAAELANNSNNVGKYKLDGKKLHITWHNGNTTSWTVETKGGDLSAIDGGIATRPKAVPANYRLSGQYAGGAILPGVSSIQTFNFQKDGTFTIKRSGAIHTADVSGLSENTAKGTYSINGNTLRLKFDNGQQQVANILIWEMAGGKKNLVINTTYYPQEK